MVSSRTDYREKRIDLICDTISMMSKWLLLYKRDLERINLPQLKQINENVKNLESDLKLFSTESKK